MYTTIIQNKIFLAIFFVFVLGSFFVIRYIPPYVFSVMLIAGLSLYYIYDKQVVNIKKDDTKFKDWLQKCPYKKRDVLLKYEELLSGLYLIFQLVGKNSMLTEDIYFWIVFCDNHSKFLEKNIKVTIQFAENMFYYQKKAMNGLFYIGIKIKNKEKKKKFNEIIETINTYTTSLLSELISNSKLSVSQFIVSPSNSMEINKFDKLEYL